jgi:uncharacterized phage protein (TIGR01671 family)
MIKFRAWDTMRKMMVNVDDMEFYDGELNWVSTSGMADPNEYQNDGAPSQLIPMQFTGINDDSGLGIYEGDIVRSEPTTPGDSDTMIGVVTFLEGSWVINNPHKRIAESLFSETKGRRIFGNIFQNAELLEANHG